MGQGCSVEGCFRGLTGDSFYQREYHLDDDLLDDVEFDMLLGDDEPDDNLNGINRYSDQAMSRGLLAGHDEDGPRVRQQPKLLTAEDIQKLTKEKMKEFIEQNDEAEARFAAQEKRIAEEEDAKLSRNISSYGRKSSINNSAPLHRQGSRTSSGKMTTKVDLKFLDNDDGDDDDDDDDRDWFGNGSASKDQVFPASTSTVNKKSQLLFGDDDDDDDFDGFLNNVRASSLKGSAEPSINDVLFKDNVSVNSGIGLQNNNTNSNNNDNNDNTNNGVMNNFDSNISINNSNNNDNNDNNDNNNKNNNSDNNNNDNNNNNNDNNNSNLFNGIDDSENFDLDDNNKNNKGKNKDTDSLDLEIENVTYNQQQQETGTTSKTPDDVKAIINTNRTPSPNLFKSDDDNEDRGPPPLDMPFNNEKQGVSQPILPPLQNENEGFAHNKKEAETNFDHQEKEKEIETFKTEPSFENKEGVEVPDLPEIDDFDFGDGEWDDGSQATANMQSLLNASASQNDDINDFDGF